MSDSEEKENKEKLPSFEQLMSMSREELIEASQKFDASLRRSILEPGDEFMIDIDPKTGELRVALELVGENAARRMEIIRQRLVENDIEFTEERTD